jgi:putative hemolysin
MLKILNLALAVQLILVLMVLPARAQTIQCDQFLSLPAQTLSAQVTESPILSRLYTSLPDKVVKTILKSMAYLKGLPKYFKRIEQLRQSGDYLKYNNFGEMGLAEIGISLRYNKANFDSLNTGRPLIIIGNHHLGIADGLAVQHLSSQARQDSPSLLFLAR